jgi:hypothetical protein
MPTSGTYLWSPELAEMMDEAFERCRIDPATLEARHIQSARRSIRFMLAHWATRALHEFRIEQLVLPTVIGQQVYELAPEALDILQVALRRDGVDTPVINISRTEWLDIPAKDTPGRVDRYFVDKARDQLVVSVWPAPDRVDDLLIDLLVRFEDHDTNRENPDVPYMMNEAFVAGLAARVCEKFGPPELEEKLFMKGQMALKLAEEATRERGDIHIIPGWTRRARRR